ncbi:glycoside hydrolase family 130 protein [Mucilaginibacter terrae]|uniref:glycoside hydrolase family 130 protein n=1 Tax=Mucilaginibacter terrae TaxID=1955052 RepID=UPI00362E1BB9
MREFLTKLVVLATVLISADSAIGQTTQFTDLPKWALGGFVRPKSVNPIITPNPASVFTDPMTNKAIAWEANDTFNPAAVIKEGKVVVLYRAEDKSGVRIGSRTSRIGYAESIDGIHFKRKGKPVLFPTNDSQKEFEWTGGCEDPRVAVTENGLYVIFYTQWNRKLPRLGVATSKDLINWTKHGPAFESAYSGKFLNIHHKSASIVTKLVGDKQVIAKINGKYWMYWGERHVYAATSSNLTDWEPVVDGNNELKELISPRKGYFDSQLTECGPPAVITDKGIVLLYNGKNLAGLGGDSRLNANSYSAGQVLFDKTDPTKVLARLDVPFLRPTEAFEKSGQYVDGTVFIEGLVYFKKKWFLYYGCADSKVAVAVYDPSAEALPDQMLTTTSN